MYKKSTNQENNTRIRNQKGFRAISSFLNNETRRVTEKRGFTITKILTHWEEIVGYDIASIAIPVKVSSQKRNLGATLTVLCLGANGPILQTMLPKIRNSVNSVYGYSAINRVRVTQTDSLENLDIKNQKAKDKKPVLDKKLHLKIENSSNVIVKPISSSDLREALQNLGKNVLSKKVFEGSSNG